VKARFPFTLIPFNVENSSGGREEKSSSAGKSGFTIEKVICFVGFGRYRKYG
jgi:hypothetical protein